MTRKIKFRAYYLTDKEKAAHSKAYAEWSADWEGCSLGYVLDNPDYAVVQYTGYKDKNGTEVYEGDIIERIGGLGVPLRFEVVWGERLGRWELERRSDIIGNDSLEPGLAIKSIEVVGNVYEHPELLRDEVAA